MMPMKSKKMNAKMLKSLALKSGVDLCGIAPVERFRGAPEGYRPTDIYPSAKSVLVIAKRVPRAALLPRSPVPYTFASDVVLNEVFRITCALSLRLQDLGVAGVPIPSEPYEYWDVKKKEGRGVLSLKHAGHLAGPGILGKNTLLTNNKLGNRITLGALLLNVSLEGDPIAEYRICKEDCNACITSCPAKALDGKSIVQKLCREKSQFVTPKGYSLYLCNTCRMVCPAGEGLERKRGTAARSIRSK
jgi:epoxyqueuosine reductase QueG